MMTLQDAISVVSGEYQKKALYLRSMLAEEFPTVLKALRVVDHEYTTKRQPKGYSLIKRPHKKKGFVYYVRYWHENKMLSSKWCTHTNNYEEACGFAEQNRERLISKYLEKDNGELINFFERFYELNNPVYQSEYRSEFSRNSEMTECKRKRYQSVINNKFIPFLKNRRIRKFDEITVPLLCDFQDELLANGLKAKSVNDDIVAISKVLKYLTRKGLIKTNPYLNLPRIAIKPDEKKTHGCFELDKVKGVFDRHWWDGTAHLLNLIIYSTGMRNSEIKSFSKNDITGVLGCRFVDLKHSKTENGVRLVPLHDSVYRKIWAYAKDLDDEIAIFGNLSKYHFLKATLELGKMMDVGEAFLKEQNITFYSGRHFWKTLMNANGLGEDAEELFMGHKVTSDVAKLYNHHDKQGKEHITKKAQEIFKILDEKLFAMTCSCANLDSADP